MKDLKLVNFKSLGDERGGLISLEGNRNIPFDIKRVYYIYDTEAGVSRGFHAHRDLKQIAVCVKGSCKFIIDDGDVRQEVLLDSPLKGLLIESMQWREMHEFSSDCVLMVLASELYDEDDYIRDYEEFLETIK
ncbi:sugar 3,4-ketoisomerase [Photobacterium kasasachensis]|uniref:sugar 3,4-ketoisomerase n=1 Tax=Photobacterium kasasachensis TaxID=2910240 RepID=UPI003D10569D